MHYHNLHIKKELDVNDLVPEYETIQATTLNTELRVTQTRSNIVEFKQTELNMRMKVGWDENKYFFSDLDW